MLKKIHQKQGLSMLGKKSIKNKDMICLKKIHQK